MIRLPTRFTISASLLEVEATTLLFDKKLWYSVVAMDCNSDSGNNVSVFLLERELVEQDTAKAPATKMKMSFLTMIIFFQ
jgi:hypothetical protein